MQNNQNSVHTLHLDRYNGVIIGGKERHQSYVQADALRIEEIENQDELHPCTQNGHQTGPKLPWKEMEIFIARDHSKRDPKCESKCLIAVC
jgi:hypothetical protein